MNSANLNINTIKDSRYLFALFLLTVVLASLGVIAGAIYSLKSGHYYGVDAAQSVVPMIALQIGCVIWAITGVILLLCQEWKKAALACSLYFMMMYFTSPDYLAQILGLTL